MNLLSKTAVTFGMIATIAGAMAVSLPNAFATNEHSNRFVTKKAKNLSKLIRSNAVHYWRHVGNEKNVKDLKPFLSHQGVISGDPHFGNFTVIPVNLQGGGRELRFVNIDFDDAGVGPFALDFIRLVIASKAANDEIKLKHMLEAYVEGLNGGDWEAPAIVHDALKTSMMDYDRKVDAYVEKKTDGDKFALEEGEIEKNETNISKQMVASLLPGLKLLDLAQRPQDSGGSAGSIRLWALVKDSKNQKRIFELKEWKESGMNEYKKQASPEALVAEIHKAFWTGIDPKSYSLVTVGGKRFWLREKKVDFFKIDYDSEEKADLEFLEYLAYYDANVLGKIHGRQASGKAWAKLVTSQQDAFREVAKPFIHEYLDSAKRAMDK